MGVGRMTGLLKLVADKAPDRIVSAQAITDPEYEQHWRFVVGD